MNNQCTCEHQLIWFILETILKLRCQNPHEAIASDRILFTSINSKTQLSILLQLISNDQSLKFPLQSLSLSIRFHRIIKQGQVTENKVQIVKEVLKNCGRQVLQIGKLVGTESINCYYIGCVQLQSEEITQWDNKSLYTIINPLYTLEISLFGYQNTKGKVKQWINSKQECIARQCDAIQKRQTATSLNYDLSKILNSNDFSQIISQRSLSSHELQQMKSIQYDKLLVSQDSSVNELIASKDMYESLGQVSEVVQLIPKQSELIEATPSIKLYQSKQEQFHELTLCKDLKFYCENQELFKELAEIEKQDEQEKKTREDELGLKVKFETRLARKFKKLSDVLKR